MKKFIAALIFALPSVAIADASASTDGPFLDLGIGYAIDMKEDLGQSCIRDYDHDARKWGCSDNPLGYLGIGYQYKGFSVQLEHWSSFSEFDAGINLISAKYRFSLQ